MINGKQRRIRRLLGADGKTLLVAVDHSLTTGELGGLGNMPEVLASIVRGGADAIISHRGAATRAMPIQRQTALVVHLSGNSQLSSNSDLKTRVCDPETAMSLGADAVSVHLTLGGGQREDREALNDLGRIARSCDYLGLPLVVMTQVRAEPEARSRSILHGARIAAELGADIIKAANPGENFLAELAATSMVPVVIAGGEVNGDWQSFLDSAKVILSTGIVGLCVGRRIFGHPDPGQATSILRSVVHRETFVSDGAQLSTLFDPSSMAGS